MDSAPIDISKTLEKLFILVDNHTLYRMSGIVIAVDTLVNKRFKEDVRARPHLPGTSHYYDGTDVLLTSLDYNIIMKRICEAANVDPGIDAYLRSFNIYDPTEEQQRILSSLFTYAKCFFSRMSANTGYPARILWEWIIKTDDLNLRTKAGREEHQRRKLKSFEEATILLGEIRKLVQSDYMNLIVTQDKTQRDELDAIIPVGKKNAIEVGPDEYSAILKRLELGYFYMQDKSAKLKIWKTPSGVRHCERVESQA
jgi:hypothetical protein